MRRRHLSRRARRIRRRRSFKRSNWWPFFLLGMVVLAGLALAALAVYFVLPKASDFFGFAYHAPFMPEATPSPTPRPTPTPHPMTYFDASQHVQEVVFEGSSEYKWFSDPYVYNDRMVICGGKLNQDDRQVHFEDMYWFDPIAQSAEKVALAPQNAHFLYPKFNEKWLVYLDGHLDGGGAIMAVDLSKEPLTPVKVKDIYTDQPEPMLDGDYIAFMDRTGTKREKLFVCDLNTMESTVVEMFSGTVYGQSKPDLSEGQLLWADPAMADGGSDVSLISYIGLEESTIRSYAPGTFVHDPKSSGAYTAWISDVHSNNSQLYYVAGLSGTPVLIDNGVVDFGIGPGFAAYSRGENVYVYIFETRKIYRLSQEYEAAQFLGCSGGYVMWMDVTSRERDIVKYIAIPS